MQPRPPAKVFSLEQGFASAQKLNAEGRYDDARALCRLLLARHRDHPDLLHLLGMIEFRAGNAADAIQLLRKAIKASPRLGDALLNLAAVHGHLEQWAER